ncbi:hypothetical protein VTO42DRAFT_8808 [Malbranchea cinnamomea]
MYIESVFSFKWHDDFAVILVCSFYSLFPIFSLASSPRSGFQSHHLDDHTPRFFRLCLGGDPGFNPPGLYIPNNSLVIFPLPSLSTHLILDSLHAVT